MRPMGLAPTVMPTHQKQVKKLIPQDIPKVISLDLLISIVVKNEDDVYKWPRI